MLPTQERETNDCARRRRSENAVFSRQRGTERCLSPSSPTFLLFPSLSGVAIRKWARCLRKQRAANIGQAPLAAWENSEPFSESCRGYETDFALRPEWKRGLSLLIPRLESNPRILLFMFVEAITIFRSSESAVAGETAQYCHLRR